MDVQIEPSFLERVVFSAVRADRSTADEFQRAFSACYRETAGTSREHAFDSLHQRWFSRLGLRCRIVDLLAQFPNVTTQVTRVRIVDALSRGRSTVELFGKPPGCAMLIAVAPALLLDIERFDYWARFELHHIEDMLDPGFGYDRNAMSDLQSGPAASRAFDRLTLLWAIIIDARLQRAASAPTGLRHRRQRELASTFALDDAQSDCIMGRLWPRNCAPPALAHPTLLAWSMQGLPDTSPATESAQSSARAPGHPCPLCRFPTFDWATPANSEQAANAVHAAFPAWCPVDGLCTRCAEIYAASTRRAAYKVAAG